MKYLSLLLLAGSFILPEITLAMDYSSSTDEQEAKETVSPLEGIEKAYWGAGRRSVRRTARRTSRRVARRHGYGYGYGYGSSGYRSGCCPCN